MTITKIEEVSEGDFIRYEDTDKQGKFHYDAKIIKVNKAERYFEAVGFDPGIERYYFKPEDDSNKPSWVGKVSKSEKPRGWDKYQKERDTIREKAQKEKEAAQQLKATTKEQVFKLVKDNTGKSKAELLQLARQKIGGDDKLLSMFINVALMQAARSSK